MKSRSVYSLLEMWGDIGSGTYIWTCGIYSFSGNEPSSYALQIHVVSICSLACIDNRARKGKNSHRLRSHGHRKVDVRAPLSDHCLVYRILSCRLCTRYPRGFDSPELLSGFEGNALRSKLGSQPYLGTVLSRRRFLIVMI